MEILDLKADIAKKYTFSVKSELGSKATLLNASKATNFIYEISGIEEADVKELNNITKETNNKWLKLRMGKIYNKMSDNIWEVIFQGTQKSELSSNLINR